jgi:SHS2 domain-containing protein
VSTGGYEFLEHTADVGLRAWGATLEECFEQATWALAAIIGIDRRGSGERIDIDIEASDTEALLVDWLSEVLYLHDARDATLSGVHLASVGARAAGWVELATRRGRAHGTQVKAVTYHRLSVTRRGDRFVAEVYLDV